MSMDQRLADQLPSQAWDEVQSAVQRFEDAWKSGPPPTLSDFLSGDGDNRFALLVELIHTDLEFRLKRGDQVRVESYLEAFPELKERTPELLGLIEAEFRLRRRTETTVTPESYIERFPTLRDTLAARLRDDDSVLSVETLKYHDSRWAGFVSARMTWRVRCGCQCTPNPDVALDRAGITVFRDITFLAGGPASERRRSAKEVIRCVRQ